MLILDGNLLAQLQKVDKGLKNILSLFLSICTCFVLDDQWSGMGLPPIFFYCIYNDV